jgi:hypothetical protein
MGAFDLVSSGYLDVMAGADPDLAALMSAASGANELDSLDALGMRGASGDLYAIMGADPVVGELMAVLGRHMPHAPKQHVARAAATLAPMIRAKVQQASTLVQTEPFHKGREWVLGFGPVTVVAGTGTTIITSPQVVFRGERLIVPSDIAGQFQIDDIRVGNKSQLVSANSLPARTFDEQGVGVRLQMDTAQISQQIVLSVTNFGGADSVFRASLIGRAVA